MIFLVRPCHHPTRPEHLLHRSSILEPFILNSISLELVIPRLQMHHSSVHGISFDQYIMKKKDNIGCDPSGYQKTIEKVPV
jgi:hypothetical protein